MKRVISSRLGRGKRGYGPSLNGFQKQADSEETWLVVDPRDGGRDLVISLSEARRADGGNDEPASSVKSVG